MFKENISQEFRLKNIDNTRNYFLEEMNQNELISRKHKKVLANVNYIEDFIILVSAVTKCISTAFACFPSLTIKITNSEIELTGIELWNYVNKSWKNLLD